MKKLISMLLALSVMFAGAAASAAPADGTAPSQGSRLYTASVATADGDRWGYIDETGKFVIDPVYIYAGDFNEKGIAEAVKGKILYETSDVYFIDSSGRTVSGPFNTYAPIYPQNGYYILRTDGGYLVVDENGKVVLKSAYTLYEYQEGLVRFSQKASGDRNIYGYMDLAGKIVIQAKYQYAEGFKYGRAGVTLKDGSYALIDKSGKVLETSREYLGTHNNSERLIAFRDSKSEKYGYRTYDGRVAVPAAFSSAAAFQDGYAVVAAEKYNKYLYGLIDEKGSYVIKPQYLGITYLGDGLYAISRDSEEFFNDMFVPKAIFNNKGTQLTDYLYYTVNPFKDGLASACDEASTFFIGLDGKIVPILPRLEGIGTLTMLGGVTRAEIDGGLSYLEKDGSVLWKKDETIPLDGGVKVKQVRYRRDFCTFVTYPEVQGLASSSTQAGVNANLKKLFLGGLGEGKDENGNYTDDYTENFSVVKNKDLLIIERSGYDFPIGAAHGMPGQDYYYIDLKTGAFYKLSDLFKKGSKFTDKLTSLVRGQIQLNLRMNKILDRFYYFEEKPAVKADQGFIIGKDGISIYYQPYEISAYAAGFPEFAISYGQLMDVIDTKGAFWNSFDKTVLDSKTSLIDDVGPDAAEAIGRTFKAYESNMVAAVNANNFGLVENSLQKASPLYNSQKVLVQSLYKKGIKEKLVKYEIYAIAYDYSKNEYKVFVNETVAVKYTGKNYVNNQYSWCYTAIYDSRTGTSKLSKLEKW